MEHHASPDEATRGAHDRDLDPVHEHIAMLHELAAPLAGRGEPVLAVLGEDPATGRRASPVALRFEVGDVRRTAAAARAYDGGPNRNRHAPLAVYPTDMRSGAKGYERDALAVLGPCAGFDDAAAPGWAERLPVAPDYVPGTSPGRSRCFDTFTDPIPADEARRLGTALAEGAECDHGTEDMSRVRRIPGLTNRPSKKKASAGRTEAEARVVVPRDGARIDPDELAAAIPSPMRGSNGARPDGHAGGWGPADDGDDGDDAGHESAAESGPEVPEDVATLVDKLPKRLRKRIVEPAKNGRRSDSIYYVVRTSPRMHPPKATIGRVIRACPEGIGAEYVDRSDPGKEIDRIEQKRRFEQIRAGRLRARKAGRRTIILAADLRAFRAARPPAGVTGADRGSAR